MLNEKANLLRLNLERNSELILDEPFRLLEKTLVRNVKPLAARLLLAAVAGLAALWTPAALTAGLAGALAARTVLPVIGIPVKASALDGLDALLSTVQMPGGIPVATVAINGSENAALLAAQMLALSDEALAGALEAMRRDMEAAVLAKDAALNV